MQETSDIVELGDMLARLRAADTSFRVFGSKQHRYRLGQTLSESELAAFESANRIRLPDDYRWFLAAEVTVEPARSTGLSRSARSTATCRSRSGSQQRRTRSLSRIWSGWGSVMNMPASWSSATTAAPSILLGRQWRGLRHHLGRPRGVLSDRAGVRGRVSALETWRRARPARRSPPAS